MPKITVTKQNFLEFNGKTYKCATGKNGFIASSLKQEGDLKTPLGEYKILYYFYRNDKITKPQSSLKSFEINDKSAWCDDVNSPFYNNYCTLPCNYSHEKLKRDDSRYDIVVVLNHNINPTLKNKGSAIFFHIASENYDKTEGCIAVSLKDMLEILALLDKNSSIVIKQSI